MSVYLEITSLPFGLPFRDIDSVSWEAFWGNKIHVKQACEIPVPFPGSGLKGIPLTCSLVLKQDRVATGNSWE